MTSRYRKASFTRKFIWRLSFAAKAIPLLMLLMWSSATQAAGPPIKLSPSGDVSGVSDRANILAAVEQAKSAGPGTTIRLASGTYYLDAPLNLVNAPVSIAGDKKGGTILTNASGVVFGAEPFAPIIRYSLDAAWDSTKVCDISLSALTLKAVGASGHTYEDRFEQMWDAPIPGVRITGKPFDGPDGISRYRALINEVTFEGEYAANTEWRSTMGLGLQIFHSPLLTRTYAFLLSIDLEVSNSHFHNLGVAIDQWGIVDSHVRIAENVIKNTSSAPVELGDASNSLIELTNNTILDASGNWGIIIWNGWGSTNCSFGPGLYNCDSSTPSRTPYGPIPEPSTWVIADNVIENGYPNTMDIRDLANGWHGVPVLTALVTNNQIKAEGIWGAAISASRVDQSLFAFNTITGGRSIWDWHAYPFAFSGDNNLILHNDSTGFEKSSWTPWDVLLTTSTEGNLLWGNGVVLDETDNPDTPEYDGQNTIIE